MAIYGINQEGADNLRTLSATVLKSVYGILESCSKLNHQIGAMESDLGIFAEEIRGLTSQMLHTIKDNKESVENVCKKLNAKADEIEELMTSLSGGSSGGSSFGKGIAAAGLAGAAGFAAGMGAGGAKYGDDQLNDHYALGPNGLVQFAHKKYLSEANDRVNAVIEDMAIGSGTDVTRAQAEFIHDSLRDYTGAFSSAIRMPYTNPNANDQLRKQMEAVDTYIKAAPKWDGGTIMRGINVSPQVADKILKGEDIDMLGPSSWSSDEYTACRFADMGHDKVRMVFVLDQNTWGASITHLGTFNGGESEVMVPSGCKYIQDFVERKTINGKDYVYVHVHENRDDNPVYKKVLKG